MDGWKEQKARWISPELTLPELPEPPRKWFGRRASYVKKSFRAKKGREEILYITAHGLYMAWLNGKRLGSAVLSPGPAQYDKYQPYQRLDVSKALRDGENELVVAIGNGWYRGCNGNNNTMELYGRDAALLCELRVDGETVLCSEESWLATQDGPIGENDLKQGETCDATKDLEHAEWHAVRLLMEQEKLPLVPADVPAITEHESFAGTWIKTPDGKMVCDFGQNLSGYVRLQIRNAKENDSVRLLHGETLDENGNFTIANFQTPTKVSQISTFQEIRYRARAGENLYTPAFCVFGFRYVLVETDVPPDQLTLTAVAVYSQMEQTGFFTCGHKGVNRLVENARWSMKGNFLGVPTDCPTRERAGWTGDAQAFISTALYLMDCSAIYRKWLGDLRANQYPDGRVRGIAPSVETPSGISKLLDGSAGWGDAAVIVPYVMYRRTGDRTILEENYEMMRKWMAFCIRRAKKSRLKNRLLRNPDRDYFVDTGSHWGEWLEPGANSVKDMTKNVMHGVPEVATAYLAYSAALMTEIASVLGDSEGEKLYRRTAEGAGRAYRWYWKRMQAKKPSDRQCEYVRPLALGLFADDRTLQEQTAARLEKLVLENDCHLNTGFLSTPFLLSVLTDYGYADIAYRLLLQESCPGWLYAVSRGATTIWETWDGMREDGTVHDSFNHYSYGAVVGWLFSHAAGIRVDLGTITIRPFVNRQLGELHAVYRSPLGEITSDWNFTDDGSVQYRVVVPEGQKAHIVLEIGIEEYVTAGEHCYLGMLGTAQKKK